MRDDQSIFKIVKEVCRWWCSEKNRF